mgnify:CR=1 FL=1
MNILGSIHKWGTALCRLVDGVQAKPAANEEKATPDDNDGPGAGGGYNDSDSVELKPLYDGPGAGGGYYTIYEEKSAAAPYDGPGAGGGYSDGDDDGPGAGGGYNDRIEGVQMSGSAGASWPGDTFSVNGYLMNEAANDKSYTVTASYAPFDSEWSTQQQAIIADPAVKNQSTEKKEK